MNTRRCIQGVVTEQITIPTIRQMPRLPYIAPCNYDVCRRAVITFNYNKGRCEHVRIGTKDTHKRVWKLLFSHQPKINDVDDSIGSVPRAESCYVKHCRRYFENIKPPDTTICNVELEIVCDSGLPASLWIVEFDVDFHLYKELFAQHFVPLPIEPKEEERKTKRRNTSKEDTLPLKKTT